MQVHTPHVCFSSSVPLYASPSTDCGAAQAFIDLGGETGIFKIENHADVNLQGPVTSLPRLGFTRPAPAVRLYQIPQTPGSDFRVSQGSAEWFPRQREVRGNKNKNKMKQKSKLSPCESSIWKEQRTSIHQSLKRMKLGKNFRKLVSRASEYNLITALCLFL